MHFFLEKRFNVFFWSSPSMGGNKKWLTTRRSMTTDDPGLPAELRQDLCALLGFPKVCLVGGLSSSKMKQIFFSSLKLTGSLPLKIGLLTQKETRKYSNHPFSGAMLVSGRVYTRWFKPWLFLSPNVGLVTFTAFPKGHVNSPSQKGHKELPVI